MASNIERHDTIVPPPALDEGYWSSLLSEDDDISHPPEHDLHDEQRLPYADSDAEVYTTQAYAPQEMDWFDIQRIASNDEIIQLKVIGQNRGGLLVEWRSLRGFVPASQLMNFPSNLHPSARRRFLANRVGQMLYLRVIELNADKNRLILSERAAQVQPGERARILHDLKAGDTIDGTVTNLCDFGAFVDLGGLEGLIHISELSWGRVAHPEQILQRGQAITAVVLEVDRTGARIALSLKRLRPDPWKTVEQRYRVDEVVTGIITNVVDFGAFACIEEGLEGLIHVSELAEGHFLHPRNVVSEGQEVTARILNIDGRARRLGLSLRLKG